MPPRRSCSHPDRDWTVQDLAKDAGIATGLAHRVFARLEDEGIVAVEGTGPKRVRRVTNPTALLDLWAEEQVDRPTRTLGHLLAQTPQQLIEQLGANLGHAGIDYALTGAAGASLVAPFVTAIPVVDVWVTATAAPEELHQRRRDGPRHRGTERCLPPGKGRHSARVSRGDERRLGGEPLPAVRRPAA